MAFNGAGPELINGRLAMLGFVAALGAEVASGSRVTQQLSGAAGPIALTFALFTAASVIPLLKGNKNTESFGKLTPAVELLNGRAAMVSAVAAVCLVWLLAAWRYPAAPRGCLPACCIPAALVLYRPLTASRQPHPPRSSCADWLCCAADH